MPNWYPLNLLSMSLSLKIELGKLDEALKPLSLISMDPDMQAVLRALRDKVSS